MKSTLSKFSVLTAFVLGFCVCSLSLATQADDTTITIVAQNTGPTPFISQLNLLASQTSVLKSIQFTVAPKPGSVTRPLSATYSNDYLVQHGDLIGATGQVFLPVYGLYAGYANMVTLTYHFLDGSAKGETTTITTDPFDDPCGYQTPTVLQARSNDTSLSFDFMIVEGACSDFSPAIMDTDAALRWVGAAGFSSVTSAFFDNAVYITQGTSLYRLDLDGTVMFLHDYSDVNATYLYHNIDRGKTGIILDADTTSYFESVNIEVDAAGNVLKIWNLADIISAAMLAGGDDPSQFVYPRPTDWFHNNAATYNRADDSVIISSRQHFLICLDYKTDAIKWILGDPTKEWYQFPSLRNYALALADGTHPPIGQHAVSITYDQDILVFDNGQNSSSLFNPPGEERTYASPRKYQLDLASNVATEVWSYPMDESIFSPYCGSVYEDAPFNYLVDYALVNGFAAENIYAELLGLNGSGEKVFYYQYQTDGCTTAYKSHPIHLENTSFPTVMPRPRNFSARGMVMSGNNPLIGGFIVTGSESETVVLRALGPSLNSFGVAGALPDPVLTLYDSSGGVIATNDDWQSDPASSEIAANGLAPTDPAESAALQTLGPGTYTFAVTGKDTASGLGLVEAYDLSPLASARLANFSTRGFVGTGTEALISGFIVGDVASDTVVIRALGPSLGAFGIDMPLSDPMITVFDSNGSAIAANDNWQDDESVGDLQKNNLAPSDAAESATILHLPAGAYTTIVSGTNSETGTGLVEVFDLDSL